MLPTLPRLMRLTGKTPPSWKSVEAVLAILRETPEGASTREIYQRAAPKSIPRNQLEAAPEHPFKSMRYLKKTILQTLHEKRVIERFHIKAEPSEAETATIQAKNKKKKAPSVPKLTFLWRIHDFESAVERHREAREQRKATQHAVGQSSTPMREATA